MPRVFLSHSSKDKDFVEKLYRLLQRDGVDCFYDSESIGWGENWVLALERALEECDTVVCVLSPEFCSSEWSQLERSSSMAGDAAGLKRKVRPLRLRACEHLPGFPRFLRPIQAIDVSTDQLFAQHYPRICRELGGVVRPDLEEQDRSAAPPPGELPAGSRLPHHSLGERFVGRVEPLWAMHEILQRSRIGVVAGPGGLGKSQLAAEYAHRFGQSYPGGVYWVDAERGRTALITQVAEPAGIGVDAKAEIETQIEQLWRGLNGRAASLLVLDNFPETQALRPYLPAAGRVHTIVTTRRRDLGGYPQVAAPPLSREAGAELLNSGRRRFGKEAEGLAERLGGLPLALELARGFLDFRVELGIGDLVAEMERAGEIDVLQQFAAAYGDELPTGHERDVASTFAMSWRLAEEGAQKILRAMGELAPAPVSRRVLRKIVQSPKQAGLSDPFDRSVDELGRLSLVEFDEERNPVAHRLILAYSRYRNRLDAISMYEACVGVIQEELNRTFSNPDAATMRELEGLAPHAQVLMGHSEATAAQQIDLQVPLAEHHRMLGRYRMAAVVGRRVLNLAEQTFEPGNPRIATSQSNLALVLQDLGQLEEARDLLRQALASDERTFEPGHPTIAIRQSNLAMVLKDLGQLEEARDLLRQALASAEQTFEPGHPRISILQSNLALVLKDLGQLEEARDLLRQALASDERTFEPGHPSITSSQSNLALVLQGLGQLEEARDLLRQALASAEQTFEPGHPSIAKSESNLALVLQGLGQLEEARDLLRQALASAEQTFEPGHPSIAVSQSNLATVLQDLGQLEEARDLLREALASDEQTFEPGHPSIANRQSNLAWVLKDLGQLEEARNLLTEALASFEKKFQPTHPSIVTVRWNLEFVLARIRARA